MTDIPDIIYDCEAQKANAMFDSFERQQVRNKAMCVPAPPLGRAEVRKSPLLD